MQPTFAKTLKDFSFWFLGWVIFRIGAAGALLCNTCLSRISHLTPCQVFLLQVCCCHLIPYCQQFHSSNSNEHWQIKLQCLFFQTYTWFQSSVTAFFSFLFLGLKKNHNTSYCVIHSVSSLFVPKHNSACHLILWLIWPLLHLIYLSDN